jgi:hypothetical protein
VVLQGSVDGVKGICRCECRETERGATMRVQGWCALIATVSSVAGCGNPEALALRRLNEIGELRKAGVNVYFLRFDDSGAFINPEEIERAVADEDRKEPRDNKIQDPNTLNDSNCKRAVVLSLGWDHEPEDLWNEYIKLINECIGGRKKKQSETTKGSATSGSDNGPKENPPFTVFCILWNSSSRGLQRILKDVLFFPGLARFIAYVPDRILMPFSFWAKSLFASTIGARGLRDALEAYYIRGFEDKRKIFPPISLIGHSFGCEILTSLMHDWKTAAGYEDMNMGFRYRGIVRSVCFIQPAVHLTYLCNTDSLRSTTTLITTSRYDRALSTLYPFANAAMNTRLLAATLDPDAPWLLNNPIGITAMTGIGLSIGSFFYVFHSGYIAGTSFGENFIDTLSVLPGTGQLLWSIDSDEKWRSRTKGLLDLGPFFESAGRGNPRTILLKDPQPTMENIEDVISDRYKMHEGICFVDASSVLVEGAYGQTMNRWWSEWIINWFDFIGAHSDFEKPEIYQLIRKSLEQR